MAFSSPRVMATCRRSIPSSLDVIWIIGVQTIRESIREGRKTRHRSSLSSLVSALGQKRTFALQKSCPLCPESRHVQRTSRCPLSANSGHSPEKKKSRGQVCKDHAPCGAVLALVCPVLRSYLTKLRDDEFGGRRQIRVPATDDARLAPKAQRLVINGDHSALPCPQGFAWS